MSRRAIRATITELSKCEIFVFGSNLDGEHYGGAARMAYERFGAEWGVGVGRTGRCYAIPTMHGGVEDIKPYVDEFVEYAKTHPDNRFLVTRVGCGIAGFTDKEIAPLFKDALELPNVNFSKEWLKVLTHEEFFEAAVFGIVPEKVVVPVPAAVPERDLIALSHKYRYIIGSGVNAPLPEIRVRYVIARNRFGYTSFGNFFMRENGEMYVFTKNKEFAECHDQAMVELLFGDECKNRGYLHRVMFAGVRTPYCDIDGDQIYTGDVIDINDGEMQLALSTFRENTDDSSAIYAFVLDNHYLLPGQCKKKKRIGTVFYRLTPDDTRTVSQRSGEFQGCYLGEFSQEEKLVMARFTPNFDQEEWQYEALDVIGAEFNWRK